MRAVVSFARHRDAATIATHMMALAGNLRSDDDDALRSLKASVERYAGTLAATRHGRGGRSLRREVAEARIALEQLVRLANTGSPPSAAAAIDAKHQFDFRRSGLEGTKYSGEPERPNPGLGKLADLTPAFARAGEIEIRASMHFYALAVFAAICVAGVVSVMVILPMLNSSFKVGNDAYRLGAWSCGSFAIVAVAAIFAADRRRSSARIFQSQSLQLVTADAFLASFPHSERHFMRAILAPRLFPPTVEDQEFSSGPAWPTPEDIHRVMDRSASSEAEDA